MEEPKCPECGKHEFAFRWIFTEDAVKADKNEKTKTPMMKVIRVPLGFCIHCGYIIGVGGT